MESILPPLESRMVSDFLTQSISRSDITLVRASSLKGLLASALFSWNPEMTLWLSYWKDQDSRGDQSSNCRHQSAEYAREDSLDPPTTEPVLCEKPVKNEAYWDSPFDIPSWAPSQEPASTASHMRAPFWKISSVTPSMTAAPANIWLQLHERAHARTTELSPVHPQNRELLWTPTELWTELRF